MSIPVIQDPMLEKLKRIDAKNTQQKIVDGLRGTGPGVKKISAQTPTITMANSPRFGGLTAGGIVNGLTSGISKIGQIPVGGGLTLGGATTGTLNTLGRIDAIGRVLNTELSDRDRGIAATGVINPLLGLTVSGMAAFDDYMAKLTGVSSNDPYVSGRGEGRTAFNSGNTRTKVKASTGDSKFADLRGSITPGSMQPAAINLGEGASMDAAERFRAGAGFPAGVTRPDDYPTLLKTPGNSGLNDRGPSAAELFNKYKQQGLDEKTARKKAEDEGMRIWANKYKDTLAKEVKEGQAGYNVIQDTLYPNTEEGFANPNRPGVIEMIDGKRLEKPMSINEFNATQEVNDFDLNPLGTLSVLAKKDPQKALSDFMSANNLVGDFTTASEPIVGSFSQKEYPLMTENYFGFGK